LQQKVHQARHNKDFVDDSGEHKKITAAGQSARLDEAYFLSGDRGRPARRGMNARLTEELNMAQTSDGDTAGVY
jgi:hypothetical protein